MRFHNRATVAVLVVVVSSHFLASTSAVALPHKHSKPNDLILKLCKKTEHVDLCIKSVTENIKGTPTGISVLNAEIDASSKGVNMALAQVTNLLKSASKQEKMILSTCKENYGFAIDSLKDAKTSIRARDRDSVMTQLTAVISYVNTCEDSYAEFFIPSPLKKLDELLVDLAGNSLAITKEIVL